VILFAMSRKMPRRLQRLVGDIVAEPRFVRPVGFAFDGSIIHDMNLVSVGGMVTAAAGMQDKDATALWLWRGI
jgi:hypothetical protein